jgi:integral membrane sensor domain MASE1
MTPDLPPSETAGPVLDPRVIRPVTIPILVSSLANLIAGYLWFLASCLGIFVSAPLLVLAAFELWTFTRASRLGAEELRRRVTLLGLLELVAGVFNLVSLVCATVALLSLDKVERRLRGLEPSDGPT